MRCMAGKATDGVGVLWPLGSRSRRRNEYRGTSILVWVLREPFRPGVCVLQSAKAAGTAVGPAGILPVLGRPHGDTTEADPPLKIMHKRLPLDG